MRASLHDLWGCGRGPVSRLAPRSRIVVGVVGLGACMTAPASTKSGAALIASLVLLWLLACRPPGRVVRASAAIAFSMFLPYFLLLPWLGTGPSPGRWLQGLPIAVGIFVHGVAGVLISVATVTTLSVSELRDGLSRLPIPGLVSAILLQIVHQTASLGYETRRVAAAMSVRGASGGGLAAWRVLSSLPQVWLPRVVVRAERVASAMEVRGYCEQDLPASDGVAAGARDAIALALMVLTLALAAALRYWHVA